MRRWILSLLLFALPLQALAVAWLSAPPCPMEAMAMTQGMMNTLSASDLAPADVPDCCNDADTFAITGKACKAAQECGATSLAPSLLASAQPQRWLAPALEPGAALTVPLPPDLVARPWRPPAFL